MTVKRWGRTPTIRRVPLAAAVVALAVVGVLMYMLIRIIVPFQTENPLWNEATVGEPVIDNWWYGGENEEGYLLFKNTDNRTAELPPTAKMLALDGKFVMIEHFSPQAVVFAKPLAAIPTRWWLISGIVILGAVGATALTLKLRPTQSRFQASKARQSVALSRGMGSGAKARRFKSRKPLRR